jgi:hypothetical protein
MVNQQKWLVSIRTLSLVGKEAIARLQYAIRGLLRIMCIHLNGVVLFIDDLQVRNLCFRGGYLFMAHPI